ncbi:hypothetical protein [Paenibacillus sp. USHLN196]|uniref:hypothetical protein n=1 Tax=Paenibacillus sp. USHLN196 TaxID=3081291 RepID=UPI00301AC7FA
MKPYSKITSRGYQNEIDETEKAILEAVELNGAVTLQGFESEEAVREFISKFPKYIKLKLSSIESDYDYAEYGIRSVKNTRKKWDEFHTYGVILEISSLNAVTGDKNEAGLKRAKGFTSQLLKMNLIQGEN